MKKLITLIFVALLSLTAMSQGTSCGTAITLADGACLTNQQFPGSVNMSGLCVGGNNPSIYISFVAGNCSQFTITSSNSSSTVGHRFLTGGCSYVSGSLECHDNVVAGVPFTASDYSFNGTDLLTSGQTYVLHLWGPVGTSQFEICYEANANEEPSNECSGASSLGTSPTTFYNGGDCSYAGSYDDNLGGENDPAPIDLCAGSLENTQWVTFTPMAGVSSFDIIGSNINCTGGGCGFQFGLFSGSCGSLVSEGCYGNKVCSGGQSTSGPINSAGSPYSVSWSGTSATGFTATISINSGTFTGTETFYLVMDGNADADCQYTLQGINVQVLPIELVNFVGDYRDGINPYINIIWSTASETNNEYFLLEKSYNGYSWENNHIESGDGNSLVLKTYNYKDYKIKSGTVYYRLSQTDFDGNREYLKVIAVSVPYGYEPKLIGRFNLMGIEINDYENYNGVVIEIYDDNSTKRIMKISH